MQELQEYTKNQLGKFDPVEVIRVQYIQDLTVAYKDHEKTLLALQDANDLLKKRQAERQRVIDVLNRHIKLVQSNVLGSQSNMALLAVIDDVLKAIDR